MIRGMHGLFFTPKAEEARDFIRDKLGFSHVDSGDGWLIFRVPLAELGRSTRRRSVAAGHLSRVLRGWAGPRSGLAAAAAGGLAPVWTWFGGDRVERRDRDLDHPTVSRKSNTVRCA